MQSATVDVDVLIVGAGPVGLFLANECARRGLRWRLIEKRAAQSEHSKALAIFPRTLEIFDMAGIAAPFTQAANQVTQIHVATPRRTLAQVPFAPDDSPYPFIAMVPQDVTERLLVESLRARGGAVEYQTAFVAADQQRERVNVTLQRDDGGRETVSAAFVVGCDGARSKVRQALELAFEGGEYQERFMLADVETNDAFPANATQLCPNRHGPLAIFPMSASRRRIVAMIENPEGDAPSLELVQTLLAARAPAGIEARALHWSSYFHIHHRRVSQLRKGRMFVAGDAAHIHSPFGGQGMNTGLHDVWNLAWKLDLSLRGHGNDVLLDSYSAERMPVIKGVIDTTDFLTRALGTPNRLAEALRNAIIPIVSRWPPFRRALVRKLSELDIHYRGSPIVEGAGQRFCDDSLRGGGILDRFVLFVDAQAPAPVLDDARRLVASRTAVVELRRGAHAGIALVRPDGYVACLASKANSVGLASVLAVLDRQTA